MNATERIVLIVGLMTFAGFWASRIHFQAPRRVEAAKRRGMLKEALALIATISVISLAGLYVVEGEHSRQDLWVMEHPLPQYGVRLWIPVEGPHEKCEKALWTEATATAFVFELVNRINTHEVHYHLNAKNDEIHFDEFTLGEQGERRLRPPEVHYHIIYTGLEPAKELIATVKAHQHGAD